MALNQTNRFQSLDSSVEEFIDGQENENTKKKTKQNIALFHDFRVLISIQLIIPCPAVYIDASVTLIVPLTFIA